MEMIGTIQKRINNSSGYILGEDGKLYLYFLYDFLDNEDYPLGTKVLFKNEEENKILRATYISKYHGEDK